MSKKIFIVFDCDKTISDTHTMFYPAKKLFGEEIEKICKEKDAELWATGHEYFLNLLRERKIKDEDLNKAIDDIPLCPNIKDAFEFIKANKEKCKMIILTSNLQLLSEQMMKHLNYYDLFDAFIGSRQIETDPKKEKPRIYPNKIDDRCPLCKPNPCKVNTMAEYLSYNPIEGKDDIKVFICDGGNDFCYAKSLSEKDYVLARKGYGLLKKLKEEDKEKEIKAKIKVWEDGKEMAKLLEDIFYKVN